MAREKISGNRPVRIYYDMLEINGDVCCILPGCPFIEMPWRQATEAAEKNISENKWKKYIIPDLTGKKVEYLGDENHQEDVIQLKCSCGNYEELKPDEDLRNTHQFIFSSMVSGSQDEAYYICLECLNEIKSQSYEHLIDC